MIQIVIEIIMGAFTIFLGVRILGLVYPVIIEGVKDENN